MSLSPSRVFAELNAARPPDQAVPDDGNGRRGRWQYRRPAGRPGAVRPRRHASSSSTGTTRRWPARGPAYPRGRNCTRCCPAASSSWSGCFPGFREEALARGAVEAPPEARRNYLDGASKVVVPDDADSLAGSRPLLEGLIRQQVLRLPNVKTITARATGLVFDGAAVTGVRCEVGGVVGVETG